MPSSKGDPTDPELREKIKEEVKNEEKGKDLSCITPVSWSPPMPLLFPLFSSLLFMPGKSH